MHPPPQTIQMICWVPVVVVVDTAFQFEGAPKGLGHAQPSRVR